MLNSATLTEDREAGQSCSRCRRFAARLGSLDKPQTINRPNMSILVELKTRRSQELYGAILRFVLRVALTAERKGVPGLVRLSLQHILEARRPTPQAGS